MEKRPKANMCAGIIYTISESEKAEKSKTGSWDGVTS